MSQPLSEYFAQEAAEYLDRLDALLARADAPDPVEFFRAVRGIRGSAQIAGAEGVARVAEGMEDAARALRDGALAWTGDVAARARDTAADLRTLVHAAGRWGPGEDARANAALARWDAASGGRRRGGPAPSGGQIYDFLRREIGGVVGEMDRALAELRESPTAREPLRTVLRRMRPVRGVAGMDTVSPVLELLEGIEDAAHEVLGRTTPVTGREMELLSAGRDALAAAGTALERGTNVGDTPELERFRQIRDAMEGTAEDATVIPIASLFYDDGGPHVVSSPLAPAAKEGTTLADEAESFLRMEATGFLDRAEGLIGSLSTRPARFTRIARELRELVRGVADLAVTYGMATIAGAAEEASTRISRAVSPDEARGALLRLRSHLPGAAPMAEEPAASASTASSVATVAPAQVAEDGVVPVEALVYDPDEALHEALRLREHIQSLSANGGAALTEALDELFALIAIGVERRTAAVG